MWSRRINNIFPGDGIRTKEVVVVRVVVGEVPMAAEVETATAGEVGPTRMGAANIMTSLGIIILGTIITIEEGEVRAVLVGTPTTMVLRFQQIRDLVIHLLLFIGFCGIRSFGGLEKCMAFA